MNPRPPGYEPDELPNCSTPRHPVFQTATIILHDFFSVVKCFFQILRISGYPKEYEWSAAFGLVFTVIWLYLKILELVIRITGKNKE